jgi:hypothetical protein
MIKRKALSKAEIKKAASDAVQRGRLREDVRDLTLRALKGRTLDGSRIKEVVSAVTQGISVGAARHAGDFRDSLSTAFAGIDEALSKAAEASHLALRELASRADDVNRHELRRLLKQTQQPEDQFFSSVRQASAGAGRKARAEWRDLVLHAQRTGTDTGARISATTRDFSSNTARLTEDSAKAGFRAAGDLGARFVAISSGVLAGIADALQDRSSRSRAPAKAANARTPSGRKAAASPRRPGRRG